MSSKKINTIFGSKKATEVEQAYIRLVLFGVASIYFIWIDSKFVSDNASFILYIYIICAISIAFVTLFIVIKFPEFRPFARKFHLVFDGLMAMISFLILGQYASPIFFTYLFIAIGYGMRYSLNYLVVGLFAGLAMHTIGVVFSSYNPSWPDLLKDYVLLLVLPVYTGLLIHRLNISYKETEKALEKAESASRAKTMFLANISHDLRTPLVGVGTAVDLMQTEGWAKEDVRLLKTIKSSSEVLEQQINHILEFARSESGGLKIIYSQVALKRLLEDCKTILQPQAAAKNVEFVFNHNVPACVESSDTVLRKIILNLVGNAIKFTERGTVSVDISCRKNTLYILITDTGVGIPSDKIESVFEPFIQADGTITRKYGGTGLGLAITRQLLDELGGDLHLDSEVGAGTDVSLVIPVKLLQDSDCQQETISDQESYSDFGSSNILVADDNITNRHVIELVLRKGGYKNFDIVTDGSEALRKMLGTDYDLVILDRHMPEMDGGSVLQEYNSRSSRQVKSIFLTADQTDEALEESEAVGFDAFVKKPFKPDELLHVINELLVASERE